MQVAGAPPSRRAAGALSPYAGLCCSVAAPLQREHLLHSCTTSREHEALHANLSGVDASLARWGAALAEQKRDLRQKDPIYVQHGFRDSELPCSLVDDALDAALCDAHQADAWRTPTFPVPYWYVSIPPAGTPFRGPHAEEIMIPPAQAAERLRPVALVKYVLTSAAEREQQERHPATTREASGVDEFFPSGGRYAKSRLVAEARESLKASVESIAEPAGLYFSGVDRIHKKTGHGLPAGCSPFADFTWRPRVLDAWCLRDTESSAAAHYGGDFSKFKSGAMFENAFDTSGRAAPGSTVLAAVGAHPVHVRHLLQHGYSADFTEDPRVPTFPSAKQFMTLGKGVFLTTQWGKADQYAVPLDEGWATAEAFDFAAYEAVHARDAGAPTADYASSDLRKAPRYMLLVEASVHGAFVLPAGVADLQGANVPMLDWVLYWRLQQDQ